MKSRLSVKALTVDNNLSRQIQPIKSWQSATYNPNGGKTPQSRQALETLVNAVRGSQYDAQW